MRKILINLFILINFNKNLFIFLYSNRSIITAEKVALDDSEKDMVKKE